MGYQRRKVRLKTFTRVEFKGIEGGSLELEYSNFGEPYREGLRIIINDLDQGVSSYATIDSSDLEDFAEVINRACDVDFKNNEPDWRLWSPDPSMNSSKLWVVTYGGMVIGTISKQFDRSDKYRREFYSIENTDWFAVNSFETPDLAACALVEAWETNRTVYTTK